ncbi:MAG: competence/damage-inducible protein A [Chloroflexi bacterium]|nr:competence/damage-inducible protein A [Chloroflexota bacterium]MBM3182731.1 competence/damage-inducible protein A [Chloroflexota bacterium]
MKTEIISIGTELLLGEIVDTNSAYLASQLPLLGLDLHFISTVGDNQQRLINILQQAWQRSDIIFTTGGLGPTQDDITREAIAEFLDEEISTDPQLVKEFERLFKRFKMEMPRSNLKQAGIIPSAQIIANPRGTAPGWWIERDNHTIITMPGPPNEMQLMWTKVIMPRLQQKLGRAIIVSKTLKVFGLSEAKVDELVSSFLASSNPTVGTYAKPDGIHLRITAKSCTTNDAQTLITEKEKDIRAILGDNIWGTDADSLEATVGTLLTSKGLTLASMESSTGGLLANCITNIPGSSKYFKGGIIAYTGKTNTSYGIDEQLISKHGLVSTEVTEAMASAVRHHLHADIGIALTAITGPAEIEGKPIGTICIGIDNGQHTSSFTRNYPGNRPQVKQRAVISALFELRRVLL